MASSMRVCCKSSFRSLISLPSPIRSLNSRNLKYIPAVIPNNNSLNARRFGFRQASSFFSDAAATSKKPDSGPSAEVPAVDAPSDTKSEQKESLAKKSTDTQALEEKNKQLLVQLEEVQDKYRRALAETENVRQRLNRQIQDAKLFGIHGFCKDLLTVADILGKATESVPREELSRADNASLKLLYEGLQMTESELVKVFTRHGLVPISPVEGEKFDPNCHEALFQQPPTNGKVAGTIAVVSKVGYKLHSRTLRPAIVGVFAQS